MVTTASRVPPVHIRARYVRAEALDAVAADADGAAPPWKASRERGHGRWSEFRYDPTSDGAGILSAVRPATEALHPMTVTVDTILARDSEPIPATVGEEVVVLSIRAGSYFGFNRVGTEIWNMLAEPRRVDQIFDALSQLHDVDAETMIRDVTPFLQTLIERRLVRVVDPGGAG